MTLHSDTSRPNPALPIFSPYAITRPFSRVGILGAGEPAMDFARSLLEADVPVTVFELDRVSLDMATAATRAQYQNAVIDGELTASQCDRCIALLAGTVNLHHLKDCDVIVDMLDASPAVKDGLLRRLKEVARTDAVLLTCAEGSDVSRTASQMRFPENVLGLRKSCGAGTGQWELVPAEVTSERALAAATRLIQHLDLSPMAAAHPAVC